MNISKEKQELNQLLDSFGDKKYAVIRSILFDEANKFAIDEIGHLAISLHSSCNNLIPVIKHFTPEYFVYL